MFNAIMYFSYSLKICKLAKQKKKKKKKGK